MKSQPAQAVLDAHYLETRAKLLEVAAVLDRIDRAGTAPSSRSSDAASQASDADAPAGDADARRSQIDEAIRILLEDSPRRAELIQQLFSRPYDPQWRTDFGLQVEHASPSPTRES